MKFLVVFFALCSVAHAQTHKIFGGVDVSISDFPYQVSVRYYDTHICGGSILDENTILTAAHCMRRADHSQYSVRLGHNRHASGTLYRVFEVRIHPSYNPTIYDNDMAILKLSKSITFSTNIQPVPLQHRNVEVAVGTTSWVSGWGFTEHRNSTTEELRAVDVGVISNTECIIKYSNIKEANITENMLCAYTINHDSCYRDSGGPLVANGKLIGVVSCGEDCAKRNYPGVYAKVSNMYDWIKANTNRQEHLEDELKANSESSTDFEHNPIFYIVSFILLAVIFKFLTHDMTKYMLSILILWIVHMYGYIG